MADIDHDLCEERILELNDRIETLEREVAYLEDELSLARLAIEHHQTSAAV